MATTQKQAQSPSAPVNVEEQLAALLSTKAISSGSKSLAHVFEELAKSNNHIVTFEMAEKVNPKSPSDLAYYFRQQLGKIVTTKGAKGQTRWEVQKLSNGKMGYPAEVKALVDELKASKK